MVLALVRLLLVLVWAPVVGLLWARGLPVGAAMLGALVLLSLAACRPGPS
jgi:hypothetical protein